LHARAQTSYETVLADAGVFGRHAWQAMIIDEAHRFKSLAGATRRVVAGMSVRWKLLLTGARA
jgi:SNF2 family DNA or RNA helicase